MEKFIPFLTDCPLFYGIKPDDILAILVHANVQCTRYKKNETIFAQGSPATHLGIVLSGKVQIQRNAACGIRSIIDECSACGVFGASFACAGLDALQLDVIAATNCEVLLIDYRKLLTVCSRKNAFHARLIPNLLRILALRNLHFSQTLEIVTQPTTREKLLTFLAIQARESGSSSFTIPYNRQQLADFLGVSRSAMITELTRLKKDGLIHFEKNHFQLLTMPHPSAG